MKSTNQLKHTVEIFCCYAHKDKAHLQELKKHLSPLLRQNIISTWHDGDINAGEQWELEIKKHLNEAKIILLLISPDFTNSDYCYSTEMQQSLERYKRGEAKVILLIIRPIADWKSISSGDIRLGSLQALPTGATPVTSWPDPDEAWEDVARGIKEAINKLLRGVPAPPVGSGQEQASMHDLPIVSSPNGDPWNRAKRLVALALVMIIAALVGSQVFNLLHGARSLQITSTPTPAPSHGAQSLQVTSTPTSALSGVTITFDALGGNSNIIEVYPGVSNTVQDKMYNGTYNSGEAELIVCETKGRTVTSNPAVGEQHRQSDEWYKLQTPPNTQPQYVTAVYADKHGSVPQC